MSHNKQYKSSAACEASEMTSGFEETLPPSDPRARVGVPSSGYVVRDNRGGALIQSGGVVAPRMPSSHALPFGDTPVSGIVRRRHGAPVEVPIARITRDEFEVGAVVQRSELPRDTQQDALTPFAELSMDVTPDYASEYVPPQPVPQAAQHKTFELSPVQLDPSVHPRTAPTVLNVRAQQRRDEKQRKDAEDIARFSAQSHRRRRGPWIAVAFLLVVGLGFVVGAELVDSTEAGAEPERDLMGEAVTADPTLSPPAKPESGSNRESSSRHDPPATHATQAGPVPAKPGVVASKEPAAQRRAAETSPPTKAAKVTKAAADAKAVQSATAIPAEPAAASQPVPVEIQGGKATGKSGREVWLR